MQLLFLDGNITCSQENNWIGSFFLVDTNVEGWIIGMVCNHSLEKMNWSCLVMNNTNALAPRTAVSYFETKRDNERG